MSTCEKSQISPAQRLLAQVKSGFAEVLKGLRADSDRARVQRTALMAFAIRIVSAGVAYLSQVVLARWMGSFEYGLFVYVWVWVLILGGLAPLGFNTALIRFVPEYTEKGELEALRGILASSRTVALAVGTVLAGVAFTVLWYAPNVVEQPYVLPAFLALLCLPVFALSDVNDCVGRAYGWINLGLIPPFIMRPLLVLFSMLAAYAVGLEMVATTAVGCAILATWVAAVVQHILIERKIRKVVPSGARAYRRGFWLKASLPLVMILGFELLLQNTDILVISAYMSPSDVGIYFAALKTIGLVSFVHFAVGAAVAKRYSALNVRGEKEKLHAIVRDAAAWTFWPSLAGAGALLILGKPLLWLFGPEFTSAYGVMFILAVGLLIRATLGPAEYLFNMLGQQNICAAILFATAVLNLVLNFVLVPPFGLFGAATATSTALIGAAVMFYIAGRKRLGLDISIWPSLRQWMNS